VQIALEPLPRFVAGRDDSRTRLAQLLGLAGPFGDVRRADEEETSRRDLRQRRARPRDVDDLAAARDPAGVSSLPVAARDDVLDRPPDLGRVVGMGVALPEEHTARLVGAVPQRSLERDVRRALANASLLVHHAEEARCVVRDRVEELAVALQVGDPLPEACELSLERLGLVGARRHGRNGMTAGQGYAYGATLMYLIATASSSSIGSRWSPRSGSQCGITKPVQPGIRKGPRSPTADHGRACRLARA